jgi:osmoprotectant transport system permease protein
MLFGCFFSALLAITFDFLLRGMESAAHQRSLRTAILVGVGLLLVGVSPFLISMVSRKSNAEATFSQTSNNSKSEYQKPFVIGCKPFTEQYILLQLMERRLKENGVEFTTRDGMGSSMVLNALAAGELDCFVDYTGTIWSNVMKRKDTSTPAEMLVDVASYLKAKENIICLGPLGFSNDYSFAMRKPVADRLATTNLSDVAEHATNLTVAADVEFFGRPEWHEVKRRYGLDFEKEVSMDSTLMYGAISNAEVDVIVAYTTDARIDAHQLIVLDDPAFALPPYDAVLLVSPRMAKSRSAMLALRPLVQSISTRIMRQCNGLVDIEKKTTREACDRLVALTRLNER